MLRNESQGFEIARSFKLCKNPWSQARGLMFSRPRVLVFQFDCPRQISLHMFFVFFPIDVAFLDEGMVVVDIKRNFLPFRVYTSHADAGCVIETPAGMLKNTSIGDKISIKS
jgi:uncharacterized membrane protein (UPF0127 family)